MLMRLTPAKPRNEPVFKLGTCDLEIVDKYCYLCIIIDKTVL